MYKIIKFYSERFLFQNRFYPCLWALYAFVGLTRSIRPIWWMRGVCKCLLCQIFQGLHAVPLFFNVFWICVKFEELDLLTLLKIKVSKSNISLDFS